MYMVAIYKQSFESHKKKTFNVGIILHILLNFSPDKLILVHVHTTPKSIPNLDISIIFQPKNEKAWVLIKSSFLSIFHTFTLKCTVGTEL